MISSSLAEEKQRCGTLADEQKRTAEQLRKVELAHEQLVSEHNSLSYIQHQLALAVSC